MSEIVQSVGRALSILEVLSYSDDGLRITDVSKELDLHKSTAHRLLNTLISTGYVKQDSETNRYILTLKLFEIGSRRISNMDILDVSKHYAEELMKDVNEIIHIVVRDGNDIVYMDKVEANNVISMSSKIGKRSPLYCTSVGKAILSKLPSEEKDQIIEETRFEKLTENTILTEKELREELEKIEEKGYAVDDEENEIGVRCVGAPILNRYGDVEGAISISGPSFRITEENIDELGKKVHMFAKLISKELGYI